MTLSRGDKKLTQYVRASQKKGRPGTYPVKAFTVRAHRRGFPSGSWHHTDMKSDRALAETALVMAWVAQGRAMEASGRVPPLLGAVVEAVERWARQQGIST